MNILGIMILELAALLLLIWGWLFYDEKLACYERKITRKMRRYIKVILNNVKARRTA